MNKFLCLLVFATGAQASVYRCDERSGAVRYQNESCAGGTMQQEIRIATPPPPAFFHLAPFVEIRVRMPVKVVPLIGHGDSVFESASSEQSDPEEP